MVRDRQEIHIGRHLEVVRRRCPTSFTFIPCLACTPEQQSSIIHFPFLSLQPFSVFWRVSHRLERKRHFCSWPEEMVDPGIRVPRHFYQFRTKMFCFPQNLMKDICFHAPECNFLLQVLYLTDGSRCFLPWTQFFSVNT